MRVKMSTAVVAFSIMAMMCLNAAAADTEKDYYDAMAAYFGVSQDVIDGFLKADIANEDMPVVLYVAQIAEDSPQKIAELRKDGDSWAEITKDLSIHPKYFFSPVSGAISSTVYAPIFDKLKTTPEKEWDMIQLTDIEIVNLVNLKLIYSYHGYSIFKVMAMRDSGKDFVTISNQVRLIKEEMYKAEKAKKKEVAKNDEDQKK